MPLVKSKGKISTESLGSPFKNEEDLVRNFNEIKLLYSIEHAELRRQIEELIKELDRQ